MGSQLRVPPIPVSGIHGIALLKGDVWHARYVFIHTESFCRCYCCGSVSFCTAVVAAFRHRVLEGKNGCWFIESEKIAFAPCHTAYLWWFDLHRAVFLCNYLVCRFYFASSPFGTVRFTTEYLKDLT